MVGCPRATSVASASFCAQVLSKYTCIVFLHIEIVILYSERIGFSLTKKETARSHALLHMKECQFLCSHVELEMTVLRWI